MLKGSRFTVSRSGSQFVFQGTGFGYGLGLEIAQRGYNFRQITGEVFSRRELLGHRLHGLHASAAGIEANVPDAEFSKQPCDTNSYMYSSTRPAANKHHAGSLKAAYKTVRDLIRTEGENKLWQRVAQRSYDVSATAR